MLAITLYGVAVVGFIAYLVAYFVRRGNQESQGPVDLLIVLTFLFYATVGTLILIRQPRNRVGWLVGAVGFFPLVSGLSDVLRQPADGRLADVARWYDNWYFIAAMGTLPVLFLLFPDGHPASRLWRWPVRLAVVGLAAAVALYMVGPGDCVTDCATEDNPFQPTVLRPFLGALETIAAGGLLIGLLAGAASLFWRFHRAAGVERQQVKWFAAAVILGVALNLGQAAIDVVWPGVNWLVNGIFALAVVLPAAAIAIAVLRFRLYDLGRLVSRTVSYAVISALLIGVYLVLVTASTHLLPGGSSLAVAASTLAAAALFQPLRRRVQTLVDRRFNRARYDADRTVEAFTRRLREDVALGAVSADLIATVNDTLQPAQLGLWLREVSR
jgi:hypothetical protein